MALTREKLWWFINNRCGGDPNKIFSILVDNNPQYFFHQWGISKAKGYKFIDEDLGNGEYMTGFLLYGPVAVGNRPNPEASNEYMEYYVDVSDIMGISTIPDQVPDYAKPPEESDG